MLNFENASALLEILSFIFYAVFYAIQYIIYLFFGFNPPTHTHPTFKRHFYTLRLALPLRLLALFGLYKIIQRFL